MASSGHGRPTCLFPVVPFLLCFVAIAGAGAPTGDAAEACKAWVVQSIPADMPDLGRVPGVLSTADVLGWITGNSTVLLEVVAQYWQLVAQPGDPRPGDYGYSEADMGRFGAGEGLRVYKALEEAADQHVHIRILQHSGAFPDYDKESADLASGRPNVENVTLMMGDW